MKNILLLILIIPAVALADVVTGITVGGVSMGQAASGGGGGGGTLLAGDDTERATSYTVNPNQMVWMVTGHTAAASGTAAKAYCRLSDGDSTLLKVCVYDSDLDQVGNCATGTAPADGNPALVELTFSGGPSITSGQTYYIAIIGDGYWDARTSADAWKLEQDASGTYASPPDPITAGTGANAGYPELWITD